MFNLELPWRVAKGAVSEATYRKRVAGYSKMLTPKSWSFGPLTAENGRVTRPNTFGSRNGAQRTYSMLRNIASGP